MPGFGLGPSGGGGFGGSSGGGGGITGDTLAAILAAIDGLGSNIDDVVNAARDVVTGNTNEDFAAAGTDFLTPIKDGVDTANTNISAGFSALEGSVGSANSEVDQLWKWFSIVFQSGFRSAMEPWFVFRAYGTDAVGGEANLNPSFLGFGDPGGQGGSESDLDYMNRVSGGLTWHADWYGTGHVGGNFSSGGLLWTVWYWPGSQVTPEAIWSYSPPGWSGTALDAAKMRDVMGLVGASTRDAEKGGLERYLAAPHFLIVGAGYDFSGDGGIAGVAIPGFPSLGDVDPVDQHIDEKDVDFMLRVLPTKLWTSPYGNGALPRYTEADPTTGDTVTVMYSPLSRVKHEMRQVAYRAHSGNISSWLLDLAIIMAAVPTAFGVGVDQSDLN